MSTTAKQLIEIARRADDGLSYEEQGILGQHILSTVRLDDDEPVTPERLKADEWFYDADTERWLHPNHTLHFTTGPQYRNVLWFCTGSIVKTVKSMGHLRRIVAALGE